SPAPPRPDSPRPTTWPARRSANHQRPAVGTDRHEGYCRRLITLEPVRLVDDVAQWFATHEARGVVDDDRQAALVEMRTVARGVRCQQHVGCVPQRMVRRQRLLL